MWVLAAMPANKLTFCASFFGILVSHCNTAFASHHHHNNKNNNHININQFTNSNSRNDFCLLRFARSDAQRTAADRRRVQSAVAHAALTEQAQAEAEDASELLDFHYLQKSDESAPQPPPPRRRSARCPQRSSLSSIRSSKPFKCDSTPRQRN
jgi:hypothetical protein